MHLPFPCYKKKKRVTKKPFCCLSKEHFLFSSMFPHIKTKLFYNCMAGLLYCITVNCLKRLDYQVMKESWLKAVTIHNQTQIKLKDKFNSQAGTWIFCQHSLKHKINSDLVDKMRRHAQDPVAEVIHVLLSAILTWFNTPTNTHADVLDEEFIIRKHGSKTWGCGVTGWNLWEPTAPNRTTQNTQTGEDDAAGRRENDLW